MRCTICNQDLPSDTKPNARYCGTNCRSAAYRLRLRRQKEPSQRPFPNGRSDGSKPAENAPPRTPQRAPSPGRRGDWSAWERMLSASTDRIVAALEAHDLKAMRDFPAVWRVDMCQQLLAQAPKGAAGYRLVLPPARPGDPPRLVPRRKLAHGSAAYTLSPFQYPKDLRLCDGCWYRVLWVDGEGHRMASRLRAPVPGLYYFVGPPAAADAATAAYNEALRMAKGTKDEAEVQKAAVKYQMTVAKTHATAAQMQRSAAASASAVHQMTAMAKAMQTGSKAAASPAQSGVDPWRAFGLTTLIGVPSLMSLWLGWKEFKRWADNRPAPGSPEALTSSSAEGRGAFDAVLKEVVDKWPEIIAPLRPLLDPTSGVSAQTPGPPSAVRVPDIVQAPKKDPAVQPAQLAAPADPIAPRLALPAMASPQSADSTPQTTPALPDLHEFGLNPSAPPAAPADDDKREPPPQTPSPETVPPELSSFTSETMTTVCNSDDTTMSALPSNTEPVAMEPQTECPEAEETPDPKKEKRLCDLVCDVEELAFMRYEIDRRVAEENGEPAPLLPQFQNLSGTQQKDIRQFASEPSLLELYMKLSKMFSDATSQGSDGSFPAPLQSLSNKEKTRASAMLSTPQHKIFAMSLVIRANALLSGNALPALPPTTLPESVCKNLTKLLRDRRMIAYAVTLVMSAEAEE